MAGMFRVCALGMVVLFVLSGLTMVGSVSGQTIPKPSVPEFSVEVVNHSYTVPASTSIDPYTGEKLTNPSYTVENRTIELTIRNQPFAPITTDGNTTQLYYFIRWKGYYENWSEDKSNNGVYPDRYYFEIGGLEASDSADTVKSYPLPIQNGKLDFQVKAQTGYSFTYFGGHIQPIGTDIQIVAQSDWSNTQTITIGESSPTPTSTPTVPEFPITASLVAVLAAVSLLLVMGKRKLSFDIKN